MIIKQWLLSDEQFWFGHGWMRAAARTLRTPHNARHLRFCRYSTCARTRTCAAHYALPTHCTLPLHAAAPAYHTRTHLCTTRCTRACRTRAPPASACLYRATTLPSNLRDGWVHDSPVRAHNTSLYLLMTRHATYTLPPHGAGARLHTSLSLTFSTHPAYTLHHTTPPHTPHT